MACVLRSTLKLVLLLTGSSFAWGQQYVISTVAGNGTLGFSGDGGAAANAQLNSPGGVAVDMAGNLFIADVNGYRVRRVSNGIITTVAGNGTPGLSGDGGPATNAQLNYPSGVAVDSAGNLYITDFYNARVRKVSPNGIITTVAGGGSGASIGDGGPATSAQLQFPYGIAVDTTGNLFICESQGRRVRKVSPNGIITTVAGNGTGNSSGDGGPAISAGLALPYGVAVDIAGNLFINDLNRVRKVSTTGTITTVAGIGCDNTNCLSSFSGDGGPALSAQVAQSFGIAVDTGGSVFISDAYNGRVRKVSTSGIISTVAGGGSGASIGDGGPATSARLNFPLGVAADSSGNIYFGDAGTKTVRVLRPSLFAISTVVNAASNLSGSVSPGEIIVLSGFGLGPTQLTQCPVTSLGNVGTQCAGTTVSFNGVPAPIIYTWATQVAAIVPYTVSGTSTQATVAYQGQTTAAFPVNVVSVAPGLFTLDSTGKGQAAAVNQDGSINTAGHPAPIGNFISLFATGEGQTSPAGVDGQPAQVPLPRPLLPVTVTIGGKTLTPQYAGGAPGEVAGLMQINVQIPSGIQTGIAVPVVVQVGNISSQAGVTIAVSGN